MAGALFGVSGVFIIVMSSEVLWRFRVARNEMSRQIVHILVGTFIAFWPFIMSFPAIQILSVLMLVTILVSKHYRIFQGIHAVKRRTYGEIFFPVSIGLTALLTDSPIIFMTAILHLSLADGLAAFVGTHYGQKTRYFILGQFKSWAGTAVFYIVSLLLIGLVVPSHIDHFTQVNPWLLASLPLLATAVEAVAVYGTDDLAIPLLVVMVMGGLPGVM